MKVKFNDEGYVSMIVRSQALINAVEVPEEDIDMRYISCYKLSENGKTLMLDAEKVQTLENNLRTSTLIQSYKQKVTDTDYKVLRHIREVALGIKTSMTEEEYLRLEAERESIVRQIRELEDGTKLETDFNAILAEGSKSNK